MKGQGLPISTIILAVIGLFVLAVVIYMAGSKLGAFGKGTTSCEQRGGECFQPSKPSTCLGKQMVPVTGTNCEPDGICCLNLTS